MPLDVELLNVSKHYGGFVAVRDCSLAIERGEFVSLLGPSGCGKTTTLNIIAGFFEPSGGEVRIRGRSVTKVPPNKRGVGMVFQSYALFPHMTVAENVAFGLKMRGVPRQEQQARVAEALAQVRMEAFAARYPRQLSGGQQQRVALARAIAPQPSVLLLDEPLSNLDLKLRENMRLELKTLQRQLGVTAVFVTHDQDEALTMSDRVVVMNQGRIEQVGTPTGIYRRPRTPFVAGFVGQMNFLEAVVESRSGPEASLRLEAGGGRLLAAVPEGLAAGSEVTIGIRPEALRLDPDPAPEGRPDGIAGHVAEIVTAGAITQVYVGLADEVRVRVDLMNGGAPTGLDRGQPIRLRGSPEDVILFDERQAQAAA